MVCNVQLGNTATDSRNYTFNAISTSINDWRLNNSWTRRRGLLSKKSLGTILLLILNCRISLAYESLPLWDVRMEHVLRYLGKQRLGQGWNVRLHSIIILNYISSFKLVMLSHTNKNHISLTYLYLSGDKRGEQMLILNWPLNCFSSLDLHGFLTLLRLQLKSIKWQRPI